MKRTVCAHSNEGGVSHVNYPFRAIGSSAPTPLQFSIPATLGRQPLDGSEGTSSTQGRTDGVRTAHRAWPALRCRRHVPVDGAIDVRDDRAAADATFSWFGGGHWLKRCSLTLPLEPRATVT